MDLLRDDLNENKIGLEDVTSNEEGKHSDSAAGDVSINKTNK